MIARYKFDGALDNLFGNRGRILLNPARGEFDNRALITDMDQRVVILNAVFGLTRQHAELIVLQRNGAADPSFNNGTPFVLEGPSPSGYIANGVHMDDGGRYVITGYGNSATGAMMARVMPTGRLDTTFAADGLVTNNGYFLFLFVRLFSRQQISSLMYMNWRPAKKRILSISLHDYLAKYRTRKRGDEVALR